MKNLNAKGFTLIELMVTVAVLAILATVALPAYQDYTVRAQVSEGISLASGAKIAVSEFYANKGAMPADNDEAGFGGAAGKYVTGVEIDDGEIVATFGGDANSNIASQTLSVVPTADADTGIITWSCSGTLLQKYLPTSCAAAPAAPGNGG